MNTQRAVFVDRDGIINELRPDPETGEPEGPLAVVDVKLIPGAARFIKEFANAGFLVVGVTNQPAAAKGKISLAEQEAIHAQVIDLLAKEDVELTSWQICPHHPDGVLPGLNVICDCRKPKSGMLYKAARELQIGLERSWMIGDSDSDIEAGAGAGTRTVLVGAYNPHKRRHPERATFHAVDLEGAARHVLGAVTG